MFLLDITGALGFLHSRRITHCDVSPWQILFRDDSRLSRAVLADCGSCCLPGDVAELHSRTPGFSAPESLLDMQHGEPPRPSRDLYSFGCVLFWLLTGHRYVERYYSKARKIFELYFREGPAFIALYSLLGKEADKRETALKVQQMEAEFPGDFSKIADLVRGDNYKRSFLETGNTEDSVWSAGPVIALIDDVPTCRALVEGMVAEAVEIIEAMPTAVQR